ncbi:hypothetical protein KJ603_02795, partial [Patescibacteria group bacterium]|nr:hypothetical protein [Patescibacteria group bacterium]
TPPAAIAGLYAVDITTWSQNVNFTAPYETPSRLDEYAVQYATFTVAWSTAAVQGSSHVYVSTGGAAAGEGQYMQLTGLADNTTYYYAAWSKDLAGNWSAVSASTAVSTLARAPSYSGNPLFHTSSATANWAAIPAAGFRVEVTTDSGHNGPPMATTAYSGALTSLTVAGLAPNTTYYLRAGSFNWSGVPNYSGTYEESTFAVAPGSAAPFAVVSSVSVTVEWLSNGNGPGTRYALESSSDNFGAVMGSSQTHPSGADPYNYTFDGLAPNTTYWFNALSIGNRGDADQWIALGSTVTAPVPPALTGYSLWVTSAVVTWDANGNGSGTLYQADLSTASNFSGTLLSSSTGSAFVFNMGAITPNTTYYLRLRAVSAATNMASPYVNDTALALAAAPGDISSWTLGPNSAGLYWGNAQNPGLSGVSAWSAGAGLPAARYGHAGAIAGDIALVAGGYDGANYRSDVWYAPITAEGAIGSWTQTRSMPAARYGHAAAVLNGRLYIVGGYDGSAPRAEVWSAAVSSYGALGDWVAEAALPQAVYAHAFAVGDNAIYVAGGYNAGARDNVWYTGVNSDGSLTGWAAGPALPAAVYSAAAAMGGAASGPMIYITGGYDGSSAKTSVWRSPVVAGVPTGWTADTALPSGVHAHAMAAPNTALVITGGNGGTLARTTTLLGSLNSDGTIAGWTAGPALPAARQSHVMADRGGRLITLGGYDGASVKSDGAQAMMTATEYRLGVTGAPFTETPWLAAAYLDVGGLAPNSYYSFTPKARNFAGIEAPGPVTYSTFTHAAQPSTAPISGVFISSIQANWVINDNHTATRYQAQLSSDAAHTQFAFSSATANAYAVFEDLA